MKPLSEVVRGNVSTLTARQMRLHFSVTAVFSLAFVAISEADSIRDTMPDTWAATDALGRVLPMSAEVGAPKPIRTVGIFYFNRILATVECLYGYKETRADGLKRLVKL